MADQNETGFFRAQGTKVHVGKRFYTVCGRWIQTGGFYPCSGDVDPRDRCKSCLARLGTWPGDAQTAAGVKTAGE